jgi:DNA-binding transcriptional ArsR family regulator
VEVVDDFDGQAALRALADPRRRQMLELVWDRERCPSDLARRCRLSRPATSQHLKVLRQAGLVSTRMEGNRRFYRVQAGPLVELRAMLDQFWGSRLARLQAELGAADAEAGQ